MMVRISAALGIVAFLGASLSSVINESGDPARIKLATVVKPATNFAARSVAKSAVISAAKSVAALRTKSDAVLSAMSGTMAGLVADVISPGEPAAKSPPILGVASTYNPYRPGYRSGGPETASGEIYDPAAWTAAIQTDLRDKFGGVRYGKDYQPTYALVASIDKRIVVKINDVGPLEKGRVIDLNEQAMRYFDPTLERGLIRPITVMPLLGDDWLPGPIQRPAEKFCGPLGTA
jgi:rare lipoprotein A